MPTGYCYPFFEVDAVARVSMPLGGRNWRKPNVLTDMSKRTERKRVRNLCAIWKKAPTLPHLLLATRLKLTGPNPGPLLSADPGAPFPVFQVVPLAPANPMFPWIYRGPWKTDKMAFQLAAELQMTSGFHPVSSNNVGQDPEQFAFAAAKAAIAAAVQGEGVPWTHNGIQMPAVMQVVGFDIQVLCPMPNAGGDSVERPDSIYALDQVWVFRKQKRADSKPAEGTPPAFAPMVADHDGEMLIVVVEIDGDEAYKWSTVSQGGAIESLTKSRTRSQHLLRQGVEIYRIAADNCKDQNGAADNIQLLFNAVSGRYYASLHGYRERGRVYVDDSWSDSFVDDAIKRANSAGAPPSAQQPTAASTAGP